MKYIFLFFSASLFGQGILDEHYLSFYNQNYSKLNPSHIGQTNSQEVFINYSSFNGVKSIIKDFYLNTYIQTKDSSFAFGLNLSNNQEGPFIQYNSINIPINYFIIKNKNLRICAALSPGIFNYHIAADEYTGGGSAWAGKLDFGVWLQSQTINIGFAINNLVFGELQPIDVIYKKEKILTTLLSKEFLINRELKYSSTINLNYGKNQGPILDFFNELNYHNYILIASLLDTSIISIGAGLENYEINKVHLNINFVYNVNTVNNSLQRSNKYGIGIKIFYHR